MYAIFNINKSLEHDKQTNVLSTQNPGIFPNEHVHRFYRYVYEIWKNGYNYTLYYNVVMQKKNPFKFVEILN